jgi:hypothetical protein
LTNPRVLAYYRIVIDKFSLEFFQKSGKRGGKSKSKAKVEAARNNGKLGGRPKGSKKGKP